MAWTSGRLPIQFGTDPAGGKHTTGPEIGPHTHTQHTHLADMHAKHRLAAHT